MGLLRITLTLLALLLLSPLLQAEMSNVSGDTPITSHKAAIDVVDHAGRADFDDDIPTKRYRIDFDDDIPKPYKAATHHDSAAGANAALSHNTHNENTSNDDIEMMSYLLILACAVIVLMPARPSL
ncbi:hypothetical protein BM525_18915 (plasmid) [Alteromonas mediterranea]|uniref:Uncharacterized protein n=1 Tax=Alteromonas mediterranea TaxID=314275 RepID=A0AAC9JGB9_9ALTE|nr:hypothetical protein [Alteromonas mediterranea]APD91955.1 hypothetical protein BM524_18720 [Alteromonas mediterranea]APD99809.1 hypothetical protein BM525_18915 [Alteromonas mediterranea]